MTVKSIDLYVYKVKRNRRGASHSVVPSLLYEHTYTRTQAIVPFPIHILTFYVTYTHIIIM